MEIGNISKLAHRTGSYDSCEIPSGLIRMVPDTEIMIDNVELRDTFQKAADEAQLNVTERMALNQKFYPNGGGFELYPTSIDTPEFDFYYKKGHPEKTDLFTKQAKKEFENIPDWTHGAITNIHPTTKNGFQENLKSAINKLRKVLTGNI